MWPMTEYRLQISDNARARGNRFDPLDKTASDESSAPFRG
jgi:hypothetical protein